MSKKLHVQQLLLDKKVKTINAWGRVSKIIFATTFAALFICSVVAAVIAAPPVAAALAAAAAAPLGPTGKWIDSLLTGYKDALCGHKELVSAMQTVTFDIDIHDLDSIRDRIDQVEVHISSMIDRIEFTEGDEDAVKSGVEEIKEMLENFMNSVEDLEEKANRCSRISVEQVASCCDG